MKKLLIAALILAMPGIAAVADDGTDVFIELIRSDLQADKAKLVRLSLNLSDEDSKTFWPLYAQYETERVKLGDQMIDLIKRYPDAVNLTGTETLQPLADEWFKVQGDWTKLMKKYYKKIEKQVALRAAVRWMQVEHRLHLLMDLQIAAEVPMVRPIGS